MLRFVVDPSYWQVTEKDLKNAQKAMKEQCPTMCNEQFLADQVLITVIAVGMKMDRPYLQWLVDMFTREQLYHRYRSKNKYPVAQWAKENKHLKSLGTLQDIKIKGKGIMKPKAVATAAVHSFSKRIAPSVMLKPPMKIQDSLQQVALYIKATVDFVATLVDANKKSCPFQYDSGTALIVNPFSNPFFRSIFPICFPMCFQHIFRCAFVPY